MNNAVNGTTYRALINDKPIYNERSVSFEPEEIRIVILTNVIVYQEWLKRRGEQINFKLTNTDININMLVYNIILSVRLEEVVEMIVKLISLERKAELDRWMIGDFNAK